MLRTNELFATDDYNNNILIVILDNFFENDNVFIDCINYLIDKGIDINQQNEYKETPLSIVYNNQNFDVLKLLIEKNANININIDKTPFIIELLKTFSTIRNSNNVFYRKRGVLREIINLCFDKITNVNIIDPTNGLSLLMIIYIFLKDDRYFNQYFNKIINTELNIGVDLNIQDENGNTILMYVVESNDIPISKKLLRNPNININLKNNEGDTALDIALKEKNIVFINLLLNDDRLIKTSGLLNSAILSKNMNIIKLLINKNVPIPNWKKYINKKKPEFTKEYKNKIVKFLSNINKQKKTK